MLDYFYMGGPLFMGMLTLIFIALIVAAVLKKGVKEIGLFHESTPTTLSSRQVAGPVPIHPHD